MSVISLETRLECGIPNFSIDPLIEQPRFQITSVPASADEVVVNSIGPIAICSAGELFGGVERHILGLLSGLRAAGIKANLFLFQDDELAAQSRKQGDEPVILSGDNLRLFATAQKMANLLSAQGVRLVHVHGYKAGVFCAIVKNLYSFAIVKTEHGLPEPLKDNVVGGIKDRAYRLLDTIATRATSAAICYVTKDLETHYRRAHYGLRSCVIPNGVPIMDPNDFPRPPEYLKRHLNLAIIGRLDQVKGHQFAIEAIAANNTLSDVHLHIVGIGPTENELRQLVGNRKLDAQVHFLGFRRNIYDYIAHCDALLIPSLHEGLPYTLLESMALARPIIASKVGGLAEILEDSVTALLIKPSDVHSLALAILRIYHDRLLCNRLGETARFIQQTRYSLKQMTQGYLNAFQEQLNAID
ncbi:MAG: glycosyltransferase family 4 protein [Candidatus Competibacter sp.]|nr:glycosyltransferase family 4 protein [Candidatus Competibacter sp.]MDG4583704.1 glycosyltransferase family 4 protein [Candidatus Competibacter sp.]